MDGKEYKQDIDRIITVAYLSFARLDHKINSTKYDTVDWFPIDEVPALPFDHNKIINESLEVRKWIEWISPLYSSSAKKFTIRQLYQLYSALSEKILILRIS
jgi:hypothetical protein